AVRDRRLRQLVPSCRPKARVLKWGSREHGSRETGHHSLTLYSPLRHCLPAHLADIPHTTLIVPPTPHPPPPPDARGPSDTRLRPAPASAGCRVRKSRAVGRPSTTSRDPPLS